MRYACKVITVILVLVLFASCGTKEIDLTKSYTGDLFSFDYPSEWELVEEDSGVRIVAGGIMLQYGVVEDKSAKFGSVKSVSPSLIEMMTVDLKITLDEQRQLPLGSEENANTTPSRWIESRNENGKGLVVFVPITGAVYVIQVSPGKYKAREFAEARASCGTFKPLVTEWVNEDIAEQKDTHQYKEFETEFWSMKYESDWEIEKTDSMTEFINVAGVTIISVAEYSHPSANPSDPSSIVPWLEENCSEGYTTTTDMNAFTHTATTSNNTTSFWQYYLPIKGNVMEIKIDNSVDNERKEEMLNSFTYFVERDPGKVARDDKDEPDNGSPDDINDNANDTNQDNQDDNNAKPDDSKSISKGKVVSTDTFTATLPAGWTLDEVSNLHSFVLPPGNSNGSFIAVEVQDATLYAGIDNEGMYAIYKEDPGMNVGKMKHVKLGDKDAVQYNLSEGQINQIFTIYIGDSNFFTIKLMNENGRYETEYHKFIEWFKVK